jgi:antitoxin component of MazEF toxin-antitoxin module
MSSSANTTTTTTINRWGTSYGIRITKPIIDLFPVSDKQKLDVEVRGDKIIFTRSKEPHKTLAEYLDEYGWDGKPPELTDEDREWLNMPPVGKEI